MPIKWVAAKDNGLGGPLSFDHQQYYITLNSMSLYRNLTRPVDVAALTSPLARRYC